MTNKDLILRYVDTGIGIPEYQFNKLPNQAKKTYLRKIGISIKYKPENIKYYYGDIPEDVQLEVVRQNGWSIRHIKNPTEKVQLEAVKEHGEAIYWIYKNGINPNEQVQLEAVRKHPSNIIWIKNPTELVQLKVVKQDGKFIKYIKNPTEKVKQMASG